MPQSLYEEAKQHLQRVAAGVDVANQLFPDAENIDAVNLQEVEADLSDAQLQLHAEDTVTWFDFSRERPPRVYTVTQEYEEDDTTIRSVVDVHPNCVARGWTTPTTPGEYLFLHREAEPFKDSDGYRTAMKENVFTYDKNGAMKRGRIDITIHRTLHAFLTELTPMEREWSFDPYWDDTHGDGSERCFATIRFNVEAEGEQLTVTPTAQQQYGSTPIAAEDYYTLGIETPPPRNYDAAEESLVLQVEAFNEAYTVPVQPYHAPEEELDVMMERLQ